MSLDLRGTLRALLANVPGGAWVGVVDPARGAVLAEVTSPTAPPRARQARAIDAIVSAWRSAPEALGALDIRGMQTVELVCDDHALIAHRLTSGAVLAALLDGPEAAGLASLRIERALDVVDTALGDLVPRGDTTPARA